MTNDLRPATISEFVAYAHGRAFATPLEPHIKDILLACDPLSHPGKEVPFTDAHRKIIRVARFLLDPAENTAPSLDPIRPFGTPNPLGDIGDATLVRTWEGVAQLYCEAQAAIVILFQYGTLAPGRYRISNLSMREMAWITDDPQKSPQTKLADIGIDADHSFDFTARHLALMRSANWRSSGWSAYLADEIKIWPVVFVDAKRTYSVDLIQSNFGWDQSKPLTPDQSDMVWALNRQMLPAFQVFAENATLEPGMYRIP